MGELTPYIIAIKLILSPPRALPPDTPFRPLFCLIRILPPIRIAFLRLRRREEGHRGWMGDVAAPARGAGANEQSTRLEGNAAVL